MNRCLFVCLYNVFVDDLSIFCSNSDVSNQWWQITFQVPVLVNSYIIKESYGHGGRPLSWIINISKDNSNWKTIDTKNDVDTHTVTNPLTLEKETSCSHFRIILKKNACANTCNSNCLTISFFDIFGRIDNTKMRDCTCKKRNTKNINITFIFIYSFVHFSS